MSTFTMPRGDHKEFTVTIPQEKYETGAELHFVVKQELDNLEDDSQAVLTVDMDDSDIISNTAAGVVYNCVITKALTNSLDFDGKQLKCIAEFEFLDASGEPTTYDQFDFVITKDANRRS